MDENLLVMAYAKAVCWGARVGCGAPLNLIKKEVQHAYAAQIHDPDGGGDSAYGTHLFRTRDSGMAGVEAWWRVCPPAVGALSPGRDAVGSIPLMIGVMGSPKAAKLPA